VTTDLTKSQLGYFASIGMITETGPNKFTVNHITHVLAEPINQAAIHH